jgi:predicted RecB family nuclease
MRETRTLRDLRGVGKSIEADLQRLGVTTVAKLARSDGRKLYDRLNQLTGVRQDPCVLDTFHCAVAQARDPHLPPEKANWWWWSRERKRALSAV